MDVRRLAAVDMWGKAGARWRRWTILVEFVVSAALGAAVGVLLLVAGAGWLKVGGVCLIGISANYVALAGHAVSLSRGGALEAELAGVDVRAELRHYTVAQLWLVVPFAVAVLALVHIRRRPNPETATQHRDGPD